MEAIREGIGEDAFILGATVILGPSAGLVNASRHGTDISPSWNRTGNTFLKEAITVPNVVRNLILRRYMHWRMWVSDPDVYIARKENNKMTENEVLLWTDALYMAGGSLLFSDRMPVLEPERAALCKSLIQDVDALQDVRPEDFFEREIPCVWSGIRKRDGKTVAAFFNLEDERRHMSFEIAKLHFPAGRSWKTLRSGETVTAPDGILEYELEAHSSVILIAD